MGFQFQNKKVLVTGGGAGLGLTIVKKFYESGATVFALDCNQASLDELKRSYPSIVTVCVDLADWDVTAKIVHDLGPMDHLVNNAGIADMELLPEVTQKKIDRTLNINFKAPFNVSQVFAKNVIAHSIKGATIVNVSSVAAVITAHGVSSYACSKAALSMLTKCLAVELAVHDIRVNAVMPGMMATALYASMPQEIMALSGNAITERAPIKGAVDTGDTANLVLYLSSPLSKMITGTNVPIDGGILAT